MYNGKRVRFQKPMLIPREKRICLTRICWETGGEVGIRDGGRSHKFSISLQFKKEDVWVGLFWRREHSGVLAWICFLPCLPIRLHLNWSYGGIIP